jgi:hypothetical protein
VRTRFTALLACLLLAYGMALPAGRAAAAGAPKPEKGLLITPIKQYLSGDAGTTVQSSFDVANLTAQPLSVALSVKQFSVSNYVYNYQFENPKDNWLHLSTGAVTLQPNRTATINYRIQLPPKSAPGGH